MKAQQGPGWMRDASTVEMGDVLHVTYDEFEASVLYQKMGYVVVRRFNNWIDEDRLWLVAIWVRSAAEVMEAACRGSRTLPKYVKLVSIDSTGDSPASDSTLEAQCWNNICLNWVGTNGIPPLAEKAALIEISSLQKLPSGSCWRKVGKLQDDKDQKLLVKVFIENSRRFCADIKEMP